MHSAIELRNTVFTWPGRSDPALNISDFSIEKGASVFLLGSSGSGKSTLLNLISGLSLPQSGSVSVLEKNISRLTARARDRFRARHIGMIFQQFNLVPYLDVMSNIRLAARLGGTSDRECERSIPALLDSLLLERSLLSHRADELSVGQQQRVSIARAMINQPQLIIADEPTSALDADARDEFIKLLLATQKQTSATVLFVSHDRSLAQFFDEVRTMQSINTLDGHGRTPIETRAGSYDAD